ncbi:MAG TPA: LacI family DNA-binding transcriptional regulator [Ktedonobacteraceae bacterium]
MAGSVTAKEVARRAEVSVGTVSRVFNNHSNVSDEMRQRVLRVAADLGYTRPGQQPVPVPGRVLREVCFLYCHKGDTLPLPLNPYWAPIFSGVEREARLSNIKLSYRTLDEKDQSTRQFSSFLSEMRLAGLLLVGPAELGTIRAFQATGLPLVLVDHYLPDLPQPVDAVLGDNFQGARLAMEHLFALGHRRIAFLGGNTLPGLRPAAPIYSVQQRWASYCMALLDHGLALDAQLVESSELNTEDAYAACRRLLERGADFSALLCADDITAIGALKALREFGHRVPEDVSLIGFDDIELSRHITPPLTTVHLSADQLGATALRTLIARVINPEASCVTHLLGVTLIKRGSVAPPAKQ